jgi:hypothetical protein
VDLLYSLDAAAEERLLALFLQNLESLVLGFQGRYLLGRFDARAPAGEGGSADRAALILPDAARPVNGNVVEIRCKTP